MVDGISFFFISPTNLESANMMHQHNSNTLIQEEEQRLNKLERVEVVLRYRFASPPYCRNSHKNKKFEQRNLEF
jgi:hypothetical protein